METTQKSMRLHIGLFGRTNVGKSSLLNYIAGQDVSVTSAVPGTTTDVHEKTMELSPAGPVVFLDTAGIDDASELSAARLRQTARAFDRADVFVLVAEPDVWTPFEDSICDEAKKRDAACMIVVSKTDLKIPEGAFLEQCRKKTASVMTCSCVDETARAKCVDEFGKTIASLSRKTGTDVPLVGDLVREGGVAVLVVPIDLGAPAGRLILPQVQTIRDAIDNDASALIVKERELRHALSLLNRDPDIVIADSQAVLKMTADVPAGVPCTTFSILFSRYRGDLRLQAEGLAVIDRLGAGDRVLIAEACSHHALEDDIGRVKIPRWLRQYTGLDLSIDVYSGRDFPADIGDYRLVVHCGSCMLTRRETLARLRTAADAGVAVTNYGLCISFLQGVIERVLSPFPAALDAFHDARLKKRKKL